MPVIASSRTSRGELALRERDDGHLELRANGLFVMDTREHTSERALASEALAHCPAAHDVLVGGLGLGYTLAATLSDERVRRCTAVELEPDLVRWLQDGTIPHEAPLLQDPRVETVVADVADVLRSTPDASYDVVLLDVDNGPGFLVHEENAALYEPTGLRDVRRILRPGGVLVIWSASPAPTLEQAMREVVGHTEVTPYDAPGHDRAGRYWLYAARR